VNGEAGPDIAEWLDRVTGDEWTWFTKRLAANDTGLTKSHQVGPYIPKPVAFPLLGLPTSAKPEADHDRRWDYRLVSHHQRGELRLIYYKSKHECRLTGFGGKTSPLQDPESTSRILVLAFGPNNILEAWLARNEDEEGVIEGRIGEVVPGIPVHRRVIGGQLRLDELFGATTEACDCTMADLPRGWALEFPAPTAVNAEAVRRFGGRHLDPDTRLMRRFECEYRIFRTVEDAHVLPTVAQGFPRMDDFINVAMSVINRRKSRAGKSLELHLETVFTEEEVSFERQRMTETGSVVDFVFPSLERYHAAPASAPDVRILAVKTTLKDRWRQVLQEAKKVPVKHLFTLDEGVSLATYQDMKLRGVELVVPQRRVAHFPEAVRNDLLTLGKFLDLVRPRS
jgi:EcoRII C terminal/Restriction endonuclease EcoRII, N-terminal